MCCENKYDIMTIFRNTYALIKSHNTAVSQFFILQSKIVSWDLIVVIGKPNKKREITLSLDIFRWLHCVQYARIMEKVQTMTFLN